MTSDEQKQFQKGMTNFHFKYQGEVVIPADTQDDAEKQLSHILRGVFSYRRIHHTVGMLAKQLYDEDELYDDEDEE